MPVIINNAIPDISLSISELTEASLDGNGVLDVLLKTMRLHLQREFEANRITGVAYATAYTESINIFLQQAVQYTLAKSKLALELQQMQEQVKLLQLQQDQTIAQTNKIATDTAVAIKQGYLVDAQTCEVQARTNQINAEVGLKLPAEIELIKKNVILVEKQADTQEAQSSLYNQKTITEKAQTDNSVVGADSIIDRQNQMMQAQSDGFKRDAEQKVAKILIDTWSVRHNGDPDANPVDTINKLADSNIGVAVQKMLNGVGA